MYTLNPTVFSPCRKYRYTLWREWGNTDLKHEYVMFVGLNPSTADEIQDDPTIRRCIGFAKDWGFNAMYMMNIFAYRATDPREMKKQEDPVGCSNDLWLWTVAKTSSIVVAAWGTHGGFMNRQNQVLDLLHGKLHYLKLTKGGFPAHPLYLPRNLTPTKWSI